MSVGSLAGIATHIAHLLWSHRTGFELQIHLLMAVLSELFKLFISVKYHVYVHNSNDHQKGCSHQGDLVLIFFPFLRWVLPM